MKHISQLLLLLTISIFYSISCKGQTELWGTTTFGGSKGLGVIFKTNLDGSAQDIVYEFDTPYPGKSPQGEFVEATNGKLYGYTLSGGVCGYGNLIEFDKAIGTYTNLYDFDLYTTGGDPAGHPIQATNGKLYGMVPSGGNANSGTIFSYDIGTGTFTVLSDFSGLGFSPTYNGAFLEASNGKLYALGLGGTGSTGVIFQYDITTTTLTKLYDFAASALDGSEPWGGLIEASNGKLYGLTAYGGDNDYGVLFEYDITSGTFTKKHDFASSEGNYPLGTLMEASNGKLYGMTNEGGIGGGTMFEFEPATGTFDTKVFFDAINGSNPVNGTLCEAPNGKLYGLTSSGGANYMGTLYEYDPITETAVAKVDFDGSNGNYPMGDLILTGSTLTGMTDGGGIMESGNIFEYNYTTDVVTSLVDMGNSINGAYPVGGLTAAPNGKLYGMAEHGGSDNMGVIYEIDPVSGLNSVAANFDANNGGYLNTSLPPGGNSGELFLAANGKLYGLTSAGGVIGDGALFEFDPANNSITLKASFESAVTGKNPGPGLMQASDGNLYGVTLSGGSNNFGIIFYYDLTNNILTNVYSFTSISGTYPNCILAELSPGKIYGTTQGGGANSNGSIFMYDISSGNTTKLYDQDYAVEGGTCGTLFNASNGNIYMMFTIGYGSGNTHGTICSVDTTGTFQLNILATFPDDPGILARIPGSLTEVNGKLYVLHGRTGVDHKGALYEFNTSNNTLTEKLDFECITGFHPSSTTLIQHNTQSESMVWPGDCNYDLVANNLDFLNIGLAYGDTGPVRAGATTSWTGQPAPVWTNSFNTTVNHKHADTNGDGNVNMADTTAINLNYGQTHPLRITSLLPVTASSADITLIPTPSAIAPGSMIEFDIYLGNTAPMTDSLYGIAFTLEFDPLLVDVTQTNLVWSSSVMGTLGTNLQAFSKYFPATGIIEIALTRIDHTNLINIAGSLGKLHLRAATGINQVTTLSVTPSAITGTTSGGQELFFTAVAGSGTVDPALIGIAEHLATGVAIYPNPVKNLLHVTVENNQPFSLSLFEISGKKIYENHNLVSEVILPAEKWNKGVYIAEIRTGTQIYHSRLVVE